MKSRAHALALSIFLILLLTPFGYSQSCSAGAGCLDTSFGNAGFVLTSPNFNVADSLATDVAIQSDGKIVATVNAKNYENTAASDFYILRFELDGTLDPTFGIGGVSRFAFNTLTDTENAHCIAIQTDGKIVVAGAVTTNNLVAVARLNSDGSLDSSFDSDGKVTFQFEPKVSTSFRNVALQQDGKIVLGAISGNGRILLARLNTNGSLDTTFNGSGKLIVGGTSKSSFNGTISDIDIQLDGKIVVAGQKDGSNRGPSSFWMVMRINANGTLDTGFGSGGTVVDQFAGTWSVARNVSILSDGKILVGGDWLVSPNSSYVYIRYLPNGQLDSTFGSGGKSIISAGGSARVLDMEVQSNGKIVGAGQWRDSSTPNQNFMIMRLDSNGSLDSSFGTNGVTYTDYNGFGEDGKAMAIQLDGKYVVAGFIYTGPYPTPSSIALLRYLP